jgi:hypothetical protein
MIGTRIPILMMMMLLLLLPFAQAAPLSKPFIAYRTNPYGQTVHHSVHWEHLQLEQQAKEEKVAQKRQRPGAAVQQEPHCTRNGTVPEANCLAWEGNVCDYGPLVVPAWSVDYAVNEAILSKHPVCSATTVTACINITNSARVSAASVCNEEYGGLEDLVMAEMSSLPTGQLRAGSGELEFNIFAGSTTNSSLHGDDLMIPDCSAIFKHTCTRESTDHVFESKFDVQIGSGITISKGWQASPEAAVSMKVGELARWEATCSKSSLSVTKKHLFRAGGNSVVARETTRGQSEQVAWPRCVTMTTYVWG